MTAKRLFRGLLGAMIILSPALAAQTGPTLVNTSGTPFSYLVVEADFPADAELIADQLRNQAPNLRQLGAHGLWRLQRSSGTLIGFFHEQASAVAGGVVHVPLSGGGRTIELGPARLLRDQDGRIQMSRWDMPELSTPVVLDGQDGEWGAVVPLLRRGSLRQPSRVEELASGERLEQPPTDWNEGGAGLRTLRSTLGAHEWFIALEADTAIADGTGYHLRYFGDAERARALGEFSAVMDGPGGPVVFRTSGGGLRLAGQYVRSGRFLELAIDLDVLDAIAPGFRDRERSFDLATTRVGPGGRYRFVHGTLTPGELFGR